MSWIREALDRLSLQPCCGYSANDPPATEPTALAAMALWAHGRKALAETALSWLAQTQSACGSVPIDTSHDAPGWATGWAVLAWRTALAECHSRGADAWKAAADRAVEWILASKGRVFPQSPLLGHDASLVAWPWAEGTASWVEPTAIQLLALQAAGHAKHSRATQAVRLLRDRALPSGGWNWGNTLVFGTPLRPQVQSTGLALAALVGRSEADAEIRRATEYLRKTLSSSTTTVSLSYALIGLAGHGQRPKESDQWLSAACTKSLRDGARPYALALAALASLGGACPWYQGSGFGVQGVRAVPCRRGRNSESATGD